MNPDWVSAIGSIAQAVGTVGAFAIGGFLLSREIHRDVRREEILRREQAAQVYAVIDWLGYAPVPVEVEQGGLWVEQLNPREGVIAPRELDEKDLDELYPTHITQIFNSSSGPIFDVWVPVANTSCILGVTLVRPNDVVEFSWRARRYMRDMDGPIIVAFRDAAGTSWFRDGQGNLVELDPTVSPREQLEVEWDKDLRREALHVHMDSNIYNLVVK